MKGSAITGPIGKEAAELWPVSLHSSPSHNKMGNMLIHSFFHSVLPPTLVLSCKETKERTSKNQKMEGP